MKRLVYLLLTCCFFLCGCQLVGERLKDPVTFFYVKTEYDYFTQNGIIAGEPREASGHRDDLSYLLALYMMGPAEEELESPLPRGVMLYSAEQTADGIILNISNHESTMSDADFSLSCACLSLTCFDITDTQSVTVISGTRTITMDRDIIALYDSSINSEELQ